MNTLSAPSPSHVGDSFIERRAGFILALCFHVMLFAVLAMRERPPIVDPHPDQLREVHIQLAPPPIELTEPVVQPSREVAPPEADIPHEGSDSLGGQPSQNPASQEVLPDFAPSVQTEPVVTPLPVNAMGETVRPVTEQIKPVPEEIETEPETVPSADTSIQAVVPTDLAEQTALKSAQGSTELQSRLEVARQRIEEEIARNLPVPDAQAEARIDAASEQGSDAIAERLKMLDLDVRAQQTLFRSKGAREGVIRSLVLTGVDHSVSQQVMGRYGIRIIPVNGSQSPSSGSGGGGFLTHASTDVGQFVQGTGKGNYLRFIISRQAGMRMIQLEEEEMEKRGFDPAKSRLVEVEFGIVPTTKGYDLGVRKMITEALPNLNSNQ